MEQKIINGPSLDLRELKTNSIIESRKDYFNRLR